MTKDIDGQFERNLMSTHVNHYIARLFAIAHDCPEHKNVAQSILLCACYEDNDVVKNAMCKELLLAHATVLSETNQHFSCKIAATAAATRLLSTYLFKRCREQLSVTEVANYLEFINKFVRRYREHDKLYLLGRYEPDLLLMAGIVNDYSLSAQTHAQATKDRLCISHFMKWIVRRNKAFLPEYTSEKLGITIEDAEQRNILNNHEIGSLLQISPESVQNLLRGKAIPLEISALLRCSQHLLMSDWHSEFSTKTAPSKSMRPTRPTTAEQDQELIEIFYQMIIEYWED